MSYADNLDDPFIWLEEVESERALDWAREQNDRSLAAIKSHPLFEDIHKQALAIYESDERIAYPSFQGETVVNFWRDADHVRGIWRRTSLADYRQDSPSWETVLDLDALAEDEGENWVWAGSNCRYPDYDRCLLSLSRGGADASVVREFDPASGEFVDGGFELPEAKSQVAWRDKDSVFVGTDYGDGSLTDSGYPRIIKLWQRGRPLSEAKPVYEGEKQDVAVWAYRAWDGEDAYDIILRSKSFYTRQYYHYRGGEIHAINIPEDAQLQGIFKGQAMVDLKSDWQVGDTVYKQGSLIAAPVAEVMGGSANRFEVLFEPGARTSLDGMRQTQDVLLLNVLDNVTNRVDALQYDAESGWQRSTLDLPELGSIGLVASSDTHNTAFVSYTGFLTPSSLIEVDTLANSTTTADALPAFFDKTGMQVEQLEATSADGTKIPYFVVKPKGFEANGQNPTLLYGYGGFEVSLSPSYSATVGTGWLERGGVYVLANIRGGGEFGPRWHQAALKENRQRAYDDFIAVAEDLIARDITSAEHLGIQGGSNGGLLVGATFVQRPDLFNAVVCQVPLLDMRRYHTLLAGASWMAEYGNPDDPEQWEYISKYSPYQNLKADADYPKVLFTTSTRDDRVHPGHARKMVARMMEQGHEVLYYENIEGGHGGAANLKQSAFNSALAFAYLHQQLNPNSN